ncbi:thiazole synthase [Alkalicoccus luteus]|uniref:thiazole synthase n=1 Tax=Alkalicoccus luteus TaxID=1237094 RepID=UPI0040334BA3
MLQVGNYQLQSRLMLGTGKYRNTEEQQAAVTASGTEVLTFAVRRIDLETADQDVFAGLDLDKYHMLPNTAGASTAEEAVRTAELARAAGLCDMVKVEVIGCSRTLMPDPIETMKASEALLQKGFTVLAYTSDDIVLAKRLEALGCHAVMPAASPIGSGLGILNPYNLKIITEELDCPVIVDAGLGGAADVCLAMELGADGVLLNSAVAGAEDPAKMAEAVRRACEAGRAGFEAGRIAKASSASASSPAAGMSRKS